MQRMLVLSDEESGSELQVELEDYLKGPGLATILVSVVDEKGREVVPEHRYHFDMRDPKTFDPQRYVSEEPEELPDLPAFLVVEPFQRRLRECGAGGA